MANEEELPTVLQLILHQHIEDWKAAIQVGIRRRGTISK